MAPDRWKGRKGIEHTQRPKDKDRAVSAGQ